MDTNTNQFTKTVITLEVLSEQPIPDQYSLEDILEETMIGEYLLGQINTETHELTGKQMIDETYKAGSQPEFFNLSTD